MTSFVNIATTNQLPLVRCYLADARKVPVSACITYPEELNANMMTVMRCSLEHSVPCPRSRSESLKEYQKQEASQLSKHTWNECPTKSQNAPGSIPRSFAAF